MLPTSDPPPLPLQLSYPQFVAAGWLQTVSDVPCRTCAMLVLDCRALDWNLLCCTTYVWLTGADIVYFVGGCIGDKCAFFSFSACATDVPFSNVETLLPGILCG